MPTRSAQVDAFWQAFRRHTGLDHDNNAVASFADSPQTDRSSSHWIIKARPTTRRCTFSFRM
jgi:hypothetical protein